MEVWPKITMETTKEYSMCFGCGEGNPIGLKLKFEWDGRTARAEFTPGENHQGWSGYLHGGITTCVLDEAMGQTAMFAGYNNVTARMQTRFRKLVPIGKKYIVKCNISRQTSRLIETEAKITDRDGTVFAEAASIQFVVSPVENPCRDNPSGNHLVIWDMDGVIVDTAPFHFQSWQFAFQKREINFTEEEFKRLFGQRNDAIIRSQLGNDVALSEIESIAREKEEYFRQDARGRLTPFDGVTELLKIIRNHGFKSAVASSAPQENISLILDELGIAEYFQAVVYGSEVTEGKPSPQIFLKAAARIGAEPRDCIVIEDSVAGVAAAKKAGMQCIAVTNTHPTAKLLEADMVVSSLVLVGIDDLSKLFGILENKKE